MDGMTYEKTPIKFNLTRKGGKDSKMSKSTNSVAAPAKTYNKSKGEHFKDMVIVALVTAVVAFVGGMHFANKHNAEVQNAVKAAQVTAEQTAVKK